MPDGCDFGARAILRTEFNVIRTAGSSHQNRRKPAVLPSHFSHFFRFYQQLFRYLENWVCDLMLFGKLFWLEFAPGVFNERLVCERRISMRSCFANAVLPCCGVPRSSRVLKSL